MADRAATQGMLLGTIHGVGFMILGIAVMRPFLQMFTGNAQIVEKFRTIRSQIDYGIFYPVQYGAIAALTGPQDSVAEQCKKYERRSRTLCRGLSQIGWKVKDTQGTMFVWAPLPEGFHNSNEFCMELMEKSGVICTPGSSFGSLGEGYVRFALN